MFKIATSAPAIVQVKTAAGVAEINVAFRWLPASERLAAIEQRDREIVAIQDRHAALVKARELAAKREAEAPGEAPEEAQAEIDASLEFASERTRRMTLINAALIVALLESWDLKQVDGAAVPVEVESVAQVLDLLPGLFGILQDAAVKATSIEAVEKN